ncbi:MAG: hypothetical protein E7596_02370 [Ruminococcaceae bacterium]|nr:hypothetical protein [Oscillospiraceae bacterium]
MLNKKSFKLPVVSAFVLVELTLGILVHLTSGRANSWVSFSCVLLACLFVSLFFEKSKAYFLTQLGLACTVCADIFLVVMDPIKQLPAMVFFSVTQMCYFVRIYLNHTTQKQKKVHLIARSLVTLLAIAATVAVLGGNTDALSLVSLFYYANLAVNIVVAFTQFKSCPALAVGLLLFLCCDTVIGLNVMADSYISGVGESFIMQLIDVDFNLAWVFYVPSQMLIALSLLKYGKQPNKEATA